MAKRDVTNLLNPSYNGILYRETINFIIIIIIITTTPTTTPQQNMQIDAESIFPLAIQKLYTYLCRQVKGLFYSR